MQITLTVDNEQWKRFEEFARANGYTKERAIARKLKFPVIKVAIEDETKKMEPVNVEPELPKRTYTRKQ